METEKTGIRKEEEKKEEQYILENNNLEENKKIIQNYQQLSFLKADMKEQEKMMKENREYYDGKIKEDPENYPLKDSYGEIIRGRHLCEAEVNGYCRKIMKKEKCYFMVDGNLRMVVCKNCFQYRAEEMGEMIGKELQELKENYNIYREQW